MSLSVCLLSRNEEQNIGRALRSVAGLADQVIVADTASRDRTTHIAADLGAQVLQFPWEDDFAAGRNFTIGQATGDWILWLNPDEEVLDSSHAAFRQAMDRPDVFGYFVNIQELQDAARPDVWLETADLRLFRRRNDLQFIGRCQPGFHDTVVEAVRREGQQVLTSAITLRHHAYSSIRNEAKWRWTARLLELELRDRPGQLRYLIEYGQTLLQFKDPRAHEVLAQAVEQIMAVRAAAAAPSAKVQVLLEYLVTVAPDLSRSRLTRAEARELAWRWFPSSPPLLWIMAQQSYEQGDFREVATLLERLLDLKKTASYDRSRSFDPAIMGDQARLNLGVCYKKLRELDKAELCFRQLLMHPTLQGHAAQHLAEVQASRRQHPGAFSLDVKG
jgi:hypothetical protein